MAQYKYPRCKDYEDLHEGEFYIYIQYRPSGEPFYVGKGFKKRTETPRYRGTHQNRHYENVVLKHGAENITTTILPVNSNEEALQWERELIFMLRCDGHHLVNLTDGGEGSIGYKHTEESKNKIRRASTGRKIPEEAVRRGAEKRKGHPPYSAKTPETLCKQRTVNVGRRLTEEHKKKISASNKGDPCKEHTRLKIQTLAKERQRARINQTIIETPWGPMGLYDAAEKTGVTWECFKDRYEKGMSSDRLFNPGRNTNNLKGKSRGPHSQETKDKIGAKARARALNKKSTQT